MDKIIKILLLEDNKNDVELIRYHISKNKFKYEFKHVTAYSDFENAIEEYVPDIILSDYNLAGFTGLDALELVKKKSNLTPFIIVTGTIDEETAADTIKKGAWDYIVKERLTRLESAMNNALQMKEEKEKSAFHREMLKISEERYKLAIEGSQDGIWDWDINTDEVFYSARWKSMLGYQDHEIENNYKAWEVLIHPDDKERTLAALYSHLNKEVSSFHSEFRTRCKDGSYKWISGKGKAIFDENNKPYRIAGSQTDISERKILEIELRRAKEKAEESDRLKSAFLANMSHEIRTPMNGILGFLDLLNEPNLSDAKIKQYTKIINRSSDRLLNTINDIIDISKIEAGQVVLSIKETSINRIIDELYLFHSTEANQKGLSLIPKYDSSELKIMTDSNKLHGVLTNLIKNATKYTDKGTIIFGYNIKNDLLEFFVEDTGIGIPENRIHAIFNRFEQAEKQDTRLYEGSGLGLAISKAYTEMLGGEITVESKKNEGSKFTFTIPFVQKEEEQIPIVDNVIDCHHPKTKELNLLIVEDDEVSAELLKTIFQDEFKQIFHAISGMDAIDICKINENIDLVLMDIKLPIMNGFDTTREIRKFNKSIIIIGQTAYAMPDDENKALEAGCNEYITKPIIKDKLLGLINLYFNNNK